MQNESLFAAAKQGFSVYLKEFNTENRKQKSTELHLNANQAVRKIN